MTIEDRKTITSHINLIVGFLRENKGDFSIFDIKKSIPEFEPLLNFYTIELVSALTEQDIIVKTVKQRFFYYAINKDNNAINYDSLLHLIDSYRETYKASVQQNESDFFKHKIYDFLKKEQDLKTAAEVKENVDEFDELSNQRLVSILTQMTDDDFIKKIIKKGKVYFATKENNCEINHNFSLNSIDSYKETYKPSIRQNENELYKHKVYEYLKKKQDLKTAAEVKENVDESDELSYQRITSILGQLEDDGLIKKIIKKGKVYFATK